MVATLEIEISTVIGAVIGNMVGTLAPYYYEKKKLGLEDIDIFFDKKFLKSTLVSFILAVIGVGYAYPIIMENVPPAASIISAAVSAGVFAMTMNYAGNKVVGPSKVTLDAKQTLLERNTTRLFDQNIENRMSISNKMNSVMENSNNVAKKSSEDCTCQKCNDSKKEEVDDIL